MSEEREQVLFALRIPAREGGGTKVKLDGILHP